MTKHAAAQALLRALDYRPQPQWLQRGQSCRNRAEPEALGDVAPLREFSRQLQLCRSFLPFVNSHGALQCSQNASWPNPKTPSNPHGSQMEDPFHWVDRRNNWHVISHQYKYPNFVRRRTIVIAEHSSRLSKSCGDRRIRCLDTHSLATA